MGLSIGGINAYSAATVVKPMNYAVKNEANFSDAFVNAVDKTDSVGLVSPVGYANATVETDSTKQAASAKAVSKQYNEVASQFAGNVTGYDNSSASTGYAMLGSSFDFFA